jgi:hypothetical protein
MYTRKTFLEQQSQAKNTLRKFLGFAHHSGCAGRCVELSYAVFEASKRRKAPSEFFGGIDF